MITHSEASAAFQAFQPKEIQLKSLIAYSADLLDRVNRLTSNPDSQHVYLLYLDCQKIETAVFKHTQDQSLPQRATRALKWVFPDNLEDKYLRDISENVRKIRAKLAPHEVKINAMIQLSST